MTSDTGKPDDGSPTGEDRESRPAEQDFLRGSEAIVDQLTRALDSPPDVGESHRADSWDTFTQLAWRPAWAIRSRRGSLKPLVEWWRKRRRTGNS